MKAYRVLNKPNLNKMQNTVLDKVQCTSWNTGNTEEISGSTISNSCLYFSLFPALPHLLAHLVQAWIGIESEAIFSTATMSKGVACLYGGGNLTTYR